MKIKINYILTGLVVVCFLFLFLHGFTLLVQLGKELRDLTVQYIELQDMKNESSR